MIVNTIIDIIGYIIAGVVYFCHFATVVYSIVCVQLAPAWLLIYKPRKVGSYIDTKILAVFQTKYRFNVSDFTDSPPTKHQHGLFLGWLFLLSSVHFYFFTSLWNFVGFAYLSGGLVVLFVFFLFKFLQEFPGRREIAISYLSENWKIGILVLTVLLILAKILTDIWTYVWESAPFQFAFKTAKDAIIGTVRIYSFFLISTSLRLEREDFIKFCGQIHPALATFTTNFYKIIDDKP
jgi:hypothetical protein